MKNFRQDRWCGSLRLVVYGGAGSGKSTVALRLGTIIGVGPTHLDDLFWLPNWTPNSRDDMKSQITKLVGQESWIIEGNYSYLRPLTLPRCDLVVIVRPPLVVSLWRLFWRTMGRRGHWTPHPTSPLPKNVTNLPNHEPVWEELYILGKSLIKFHLLRYKAIVKECINGGLQGRVRLVRNNQDFQNLSRQIHLLSNRSKCKV